MNDWFTSSLVEGICSLIGLGYIVILLGFLVVELIDRFIKKKRGNKI